MCGGNNMENINFANLPQTPAPKPPLGIMPAKLFYSERIEELKQAIYRRLESNMVVPIEWAEEYNELVSKYG